MKNIKPLLITIALAFLLPGPLLAADFTTNIMTGYQGGFSVRSGFGFSDFAQGFPLGFDLGLSYAAVSPGDPTAARSIFINDATNGTPEKYSYVWDFRFDFLYPIKIANTNFQILAGPRYALFNAHFRYVGANEAFDISSDQWGLGLGLKGSFTINRRLRLLVLLGIDYYLPGALQGHDTVYYPDNQNVNARLNYDYSDAADAVKPLALQPNIMIGVSF